MNRILTFIISFCLIFAVSGCKTNKKHALIEEIEKITQSKQLKAGVAVIGHKNGRELVEFNGEHHYPMQSVYKFHLALAIMNMVDNDELSLNKEYLIFRETFAQDLYSPMIEQHTEEVFQISLSELLTYSLRDSDNAASDILFSIAGGTENVNKYIQSLEIEGMNIAATESEMLKDPEKQYTNWSTPAAAARLLEKFYELNLLSFKSRDFLLNTMYSANTGDNRLKALLPQRAAVAHKTGSGPEKDGIISACNDIGIATFTDSNKYFIIAVFITDSKESNETNEMVIAEIAKSACDFFGI